MKINRSKKIRTVLIACILLILTTATCFAAAKFILYTSLPSSKSVSNEIGFNPKYIKEFKNGYVFLEGGINKDWSINEILDIPQISKADILEMAQEISNSESE